MYSFVLRLVYSVILAVIAPFLLVGLYKKQPNKPTYGARWKEHFGFAKPIQGNSPVWIHAVSVGESIAAIPIIRELKAKHPEQGILVTTTTSTGAAQIAQLGDTVEHRYMPLDFSWCVGRFIKTIKPKCMLIMETELWPNTLHKVAKAGVPISVINARLSERSSQRYKRFLPLFRLLTSNVAQFLCQYPSDAQRFIKLGVAEEKVLITGSVKFDIDLSDEVKRKGLQLRDEISPSRPVWIASSTHSGEDEVLLKAHQKVIERLPNSLLIIVPRHPERFDSVKALVESMKFSTVSRSSSHPISETTQVYIGDTMGEMLTLIGASDVCFMAGSLLGDKVGGHNMLEPAALAKPIINGPSYFNFSEVGQLLIDEGAMVIKSTSSEIAATVAQWLRDKQQAERVGLQGLKVVKENQGALAKTVDLILKQHY